MTTAKPLKPLAQKNSKFWGETIMALQDLVARTGGFDHESHRRKVDSVKAGCALSWQQQADLLWRLGNQLHRASLGAKYDDVWKPYHWLKDSFMEKPRIGEMVIMLSIHGRADLSSAVGQLQFLDREVSGPRRLYDYHDGGPTDMSTRYGIKLLDGSEMTWGNVSPVPLPTIRTFKQIEDFRKRHADLLERL